MTKLDMVSKMNLLYVMTYRDYIHAKIREQETGGYFSPVGHSYYQEASAIRSHLDKMELLFGSVIDSVGHCSDYLVSLIEKELIKGEAASKKTAA